MALFHKKLDWESIETKHVLLPFAERIPRLLAIVKDIYELGDLEAIAKVARDDEVRKAASGRALLLRAIPAKERSALKKKAEREAKEARRAAEEQKWEEETPGTPAYAAKHNDIDGLASFGTKALDALLDMYLRQSSEGMQKIDIAILSFDDRPACVDAVGSFLSGQLTEYLRYSASIHNIDFSSDEGQRKAAILKTFAEKLQRLILLYGKLDGIGAAGYIDSFYSRLNSQEMSAGEELIACQIRKSAVTASFFLAQKSESDMAISFWIRALSDTSRFVRWEVIDHLAILGASFVEDKPNLREALRRALPLEPSMPGNRKAAILKLTAL